MFSSSFAKPHSLGKEKKKNAKHEPLKPGSLTKDDRVCYQPDQLGEYVGALARFSNSGEV